MGIFSRKKAPKVTTAPVADVSLAHSSEGLDDAAPGAEDAFKSAFGAAKRKGGMADKRPTLTSTSQRLLNSAVTRGVAENAEALAGLAGGHDGSNELFLYFNKLCIQGGGLLEAAERAPVVSHIVMALLALREAAHYAKGNRNNCLQLDALGQDLLRVFDFQDKKLASVDINDLEQLLSTLKRGCSIVEAAGRPGWLLRMANNERSFEEFVSVHNSILDMVKAQKMSTLPSGRPLGFGEYKDASRPLRRLLKQYGSGCLETGLHFSKRNGNAKMELVLLLSVDRPALEKELESVASKLDMGDLATVIAGDKKRDGETSAIFQIYDRNHSNALELEELHECLSDLGALDHVKPNDLDAFLEAQFMAADADRDGLITSTEFAVYYQGLDTCKARQQLRATMGLQAEKDLKRIYMEFASFGSRAAVHDMDGAKFFKLTKDTRLVNKIFTTTDVDLIFAKVKTKGSRRIKFEQFLTALALVADTKKASLETIVTQVLACPGPVSTGTRAEYVKFHDDKSTYTGVYARGGPTNIEASVELSSYLDRSKADVRGVKKVRGVLPPFSASPNSAPITPPANRADVGSIHVPKSLDMGQGELVTDDEVLAAFMAFSSFGAGAQSPAKVGMDGARFAKLCRETGLLAGKLNSTSVDIIFSKIKAKGQRRVGFREFEASFQMLAEERGCSLDGVRAMIAACGGPHANGVTTADAVRLHDDKSTYTGVYAAKMSPGQVAAPYKPYDVASPSGHDRFRVTV